jgi:hypothetical protein
MAWIEEVAVEENNFEKTPIAGIIEEYFVKRSSDREKYGTESLEIKLSVVDGTTLEPLNKERIVFLSMNLKGWTNKNGTITVPSYAEISGLLRAARNAGCKPGFDIEDADENAAGVAYEVYEMKFTPDIIGAFLRLGVRESKKKDAKEGEQQSFKNYTVEEFELGGIPVQVPTRNVSGAETRTKAAAARRGRAAAPLAPSASTADPKLQFDAKAAFKAYLDYLSNEVSRVLTSKKITSNLEDFAFSSKEIKDYIIANATTLIAECQVAGELVDAPEGEGKYLFMGKPEE